MDIETQIRLERLESRLELLLELFGYVLDNMDLEYKKYYVKTLHKIMEE